MALRVASLDYLGTVAARLRKDAVTSKMDRSYEAYTLHGRQTINKQILHLSSFMGKLR